MRRRRSTLAEAGAAASAAGRGLAAGLAGTAAMTVSSSVEAKLRGREPSSAPADAAARVLGVQPVSDASKERFANVVHWGYGTGWGAVRGLLGIAGLEGPRAAAAHFGAVWGSALVMLPVLGVAPPPWRWGVTEVAVDALHHVVYATAAGAAYELLSR